jgi:hypothetical protein
VVHREVEGLVPVTVADRQEEQLMQQALLAIIMEAPYLAILIRQIVSPQLAEQQEQDRTLMVLQVPQAFFI